MAKDINQIPDANSIIIAIESIKVIKNNEAGANQATNEVIMEQTTPKDAGPASIGPFGWVGIAFLFCLVFACATNIYLKIQKKEYEAPPTTKELQELAPGAFNSNG